jgi:hypothetical protein
MRAYELIKETFHRRMYIWIVHVCWLILYCFFWVLFLEEESDFGKFLFIWGGFLLPLALSAGIFGDDIASGRICVLMTRPFWPGELYIYRLLGLSLQGVLHFILAGFVIYIVHLFVGKGTLEDLGIWLFSSCLLFVVCSALSTTLSIVVRRAFNSLLLFVAVASAYVIVSILSWHYKDDTGAKVFTLILRYTGPPFQLLSRLAEGEFGKYSLIIGQYKLIKGLACITHSLVLTVLYSFIGITLLSRRQFTYELN